MEQSKWRTWAKIVAFVDLVFLPIDFIFIFFLIFPSTSLTADDAAAFHGSEKIKNSKIWIKNQDLDSSFFTGAAWVLWLLIAFLALLTNIQMRAAIKLLVSAEIERDPNDAVGNARIWRNFVIVFLVLSIFRCFGLPLWMTVQRIFLRGCFLFIVHKFIQELEHAICQSGRNHFVRVILANNREQDRVSGSRGL